MKTDLRKKAKNDSENNFFKLMNNAVLGKTIENVRNYRDIKLVTTETWKHYLVSEQITYYTTKRLSQNLLVIDMKKKTHRYS